MKSTPISVIFSVGIGSEGTMFSQAFNGPKTVEIRE
jgi:hypothetical protein